MKKKYILIFIINFSIYLAINIFFSFHEKPIYNFNESFVNLNNTLSNQYKYPKVNIIKYDNTENI